MVTRNPWAPAHTTIDAECEFSGELSATVYLGREATYYDPPEAAEIQDMCLRLPSGRELDEDTLAEIFGEATLQRWEQELIEAAMDGAYEPEEDRLVEARAERAERQEDLL